MEPLAIDEAMKHAASTFCCVHQFLGRTIRYRPIPEVVEEIEARAGRVSFDGDDNIWGGNQERATRLFDALAAGTRRSWYTFEREGRSRLSSSGRPSLAAVTQRRLEPYLASTDNEFESALCG